MRRKVRGALNYLYERPEVVFVIIALPFGLFSAVFVPQMSVTDEDTHLLRAYQVAHGEFVCHKKSSYPQDIIDKHKSGSPSTRMYTMDFSDTIDDSNEKRYTCGSAAGYSPLAYIPQATGVLGAQLIHPTAATMVLFARIANLLFYVVALYWIIKKVRVGKYIFFIVALIPQMIHLAASLSADMINNVVTLGVVALTLNLFVQKHRISRKQIILLICLVVAAALLKKNLVFTLLPLVFLPVGLFAENKIKNIPFNIHKWALAGVSVITFGVVYLVWSKLSFANLPSAVGLANPIEEHPNLFLNLLFNTYLSDYGDLVFRGVIGEFSSFLYHFPTILVFGQIIILLMVYLCNTSRVNLIVAQNKWLVISATVAFVISILAITYGLYTEWGLKRGIAEYADGVQGRYFTALLVLLIPLFAWVSRYVSVKVKSDKLMLTIISSAQVFLLAFYVLYTIKMLLGK